MAATDKEYRNQKTLHVVFGVTCLLMLVSVIWMFADDYFKGWKDDQREFRDVASAVAQRQALNRLPEDLVTKINEAEQEVAAANEQVDKAKRDDAQKRLDQILPEKVKHEAAYQAIKADYDSLVSLRDIEVEDRNAVPADNPARRQVLEGRVKEMEQRTAALRQRLDAAQTEFEASKSKYEKAQRDLDAAKKPVIDAVARLKALTDEFDRFRKNAELNRWKWGDSFRKLPVLDAFASPTRIQQFTLEDLPIEYGSFKRVTRYDRCTTCHQGIDRIGYDRDILKSLSTQTPEEKEKLTNAKAMLQERQKLLGGIKEAKAVVSADDLVLTTVKLNDSKVSEFCVHPRLDLFVDANSPHPSEKFGCTSCHAGQGSATDFLLAAHTPNNAEVKKRWRTEHDWESSHFWDFPMLPKRFVESSCLKCHHQVTDLIREGTKNEAPTLLRGYNLVRENGCFGCHEISGLKSGRQIGPDLRLEPTPPLADLSPSEKVKALSDPLNPPGTMRKVGPSLRRITEKTNENWARKWIKAPRDFRPDTKMPHFYGLSNDAPDVLPETQKAFPDAEINAITAYLFRKSNDYLAEVEKLQKDPAAVRQADQAEYEKLSSLSSLNEVDKAKLEEVSRRVRMREAPPRITDLVPADYKADKTNGGRLFREKGCLACHIHHGTQQPADGLPEIKNDAHFGPNLSRVALKLGVKPDDKPSARRWLTQWIVNPTIHHPRTFMPVTHLEGREAADIAEWLLDQREPWESAEVPEPSLDTLKALARLYLEKAGTRQDVNALLDPKTDQDKERAQEWLLGLRPEADERETLKGELNADKLKMYVGKKSVSRLGCYACHDIPGFEAAKPIGTPLNDWGKKDAERLAFEDINAYVEHHHYFKDHLADSEGKPYGVDKDGKTPYETFFAEALEHHTREGFLNQKLLEPRSFDFERERTWDDRLRMPQFRFARTEPRSEESPEDHQARALKEEAEAREAVMTFILGLVAEPMPAKYLYAPPPERIAEVKGRQVLDKFNCAGCHLLRQGIYEFKKTKDVLDSLDNSFTVVQDGLKSDYADSPDFRHHNAWAGQPQTQPDRLVIYGRLLQKNADQNLARLSLTEALRYTNDAKEVRDIPAASVELGLPLDALIEHHAPADPFGGTFAELMVPYVAQGNPKFNESQKKTPEAALPPSLLREGEKVQPAWLFQFLKNPFAMRPLTILRMPRFNMSDEEAMALVNYFAAVDKTSNPEVNLNYPYMAVPQRDDEYWKKNTAAYLERLKDQKLEAQRLKELRPMWERLLREQILGKEEEIAKAEAALKTAKDDAAKKSAESALTDLKAKLQKLQGEAKQKDASGAFFKEQEDLWRQKEAYAVDAYRLVANNNVCLQCHNVGQLKIADPKGPPLDLSAERLRPEWTLRWTANPQRFLTYPSVMPQNFPKDKPAMPDMAGTTFQQIMATRDALMNLSRVADLPLNRFYRPPPGGEEKK